MVNFKAIVLLFSFGLFFIGCSQDKIEKNDITKKKRVNIEALYNPETDLDSLLIALMNSNLDEQLKQSFLTLIPNQKPQKIVANFNSKKQAPDFDLETFVSTHFTAEADVAIHKNTSDVFQKNDKSIPFSTLITLPNPYPIGTKDPKSISYQEVYQYILETKKQGRVDIVQNLVDNTASLIDRFGFVPKSNRTYHLSRSATPYFSSMVEILSELKSDSVYVKYLPQLLEEYQWWMQGKDDLGAEIQAKNRVVLIHDQFIVNRFYDSLAAPRILHYVEDLKKGEQELRKDRALEEANWPNQKRWGKDVDILNTLPIDLNCQLYHLEQTIAKAYHLKGDIEQQTTYASLAYERRRAILTHFFDRDLGWFTDYNFKTAVNVPNTSSAGFYALKMELATDDQAQNMAQNIRRHFQNQNFSPIDTATSNSISPMKEIQVSGLKNYKYKSLADSILQVEYSL